MSLNLQLNECVKLYADLLRKITRLLTKTEDFDYQKLISLTLLAEIDIFLFTSQKPQKHRRKNNKGSLK
jgi:hypothetical protein